MLSGTHAAEEGDLVASRLVTLSSHVRAFIDQSSLSKESGGQAVDRAIMAIMSDREGESALAYAASLQELLRKFAYGENTTRRTAPKFL